MTVYEELQRRGLIAQVTDEEVVKELIDNGKATFTSVLTPPPISLHVGHFYGPVPDETAPDGGQPAHRPHRRRNRHGGRPPIAPTCAR